MKTNLYCFFSDFSGYALLAPVLHKISLNLMIILKVFFEISDFIVKDEKPHPTGETHVLPARVKNVWHNAQKAISREIKMHSFVSKYC